MNWRHWFEADRSGASLLCFRDETAVTSGTGGRGGAESAPAFGRDELWVMFSVMRSRSERRDAGGRKDERAAAGVDSGAAWESSLREGVAERSKSHAHETMLQR